MSNYILTPEQLVNHWQSHRRITRKTIELFPEKELFEFKIGTMRHFGEISCELLSIGVPSLKIVINQDEENVYKLLQINSKEALLNQWDKDTETINQLLPVLISLDYSEIFNLYGYIDRSILDIMLYLLENEIHHRAQGFTYLRALNIEPPFFFD